MKSELTFYRYGYYIKVFNSVVSVIHRRKLNNTYTYESPYWVEVPFKLLAKDVKKTILHYFPRIEETTPNQWKLL